MLSPVRHLLLPACLAATMLRPAAAANWLALDALSEGSGLLVEVDMDSLRRVGSRPEVTVRLTHPQPRQHATGAWFRSAVAVVEFECEGRLAGYRDAAFYAEVRGQGQLLVRETGLLRPVPQQTEQLLPQKNLEQLVRAACSRMPVLPR